MTDKTVVVQGDVISIKSGWVSYYDASGTIRKARRSALMITDSIPVEDSAPASPAQPIGGVPEEKMMASKASKKKATKAKSTSASSSIRTVAGREVDLSSYVKTKNASGQQSFDCGDKVAETLRGKDLDAVYDIVAKKVGVERGELTKAYKHLNAGMQRMALGNRLRKVLKAA